LALAPTLALGAAWAGMGGWLLGRLRGQLHTWPGLALALSLGFSLLPLFLSLSGIGVGLPTAWPLLLTPALITLLLTLWPAAARYAAPLAALAAGCALLWAGLYGYADALLRPPSDFQAYYEAGRRIIDGQPLYDMAALQANPFATTYKYPPLMALLVAPLSLLPLPLAGAAWRLLCVGSAAAGVLALQAAHPPPRRTSLTLIGLALLIGLSPVIRSLRFGQPELLIVAVAVLGTGLLLRGLIWESAALWALVALLKIYPLLLVLPLLLRGRRRWAQALGACLIGWTLLSSTIDGWDLIFWRDLFPSLGARDGRLSNMAIYGVVARLIDPSAYRGDQAVPAAALPSLLLCTLLLLASVWLLWRRREQMETQIWPALGMMVCTVLLVIPVGWDHYHALLLLPLIVSLGALGQPRDDATLWLGAYTLLVFGVSRDFWPTSEQTPTAFALFFGSYRTLGALLLWLWFARRPSHTPPDERALCE
ncbi:MAG: DUF2029 domain-containing protein, partial [Oscillochloris sp.]|nr:DUF2029 domain-containing protein [Oscillochloris sp.]